MTRSNVTTKICVSSIEAQIPHIIPNLSGSAAAGTNRWKRYHKSGATGAVILRRFHATKLPLLADVTEHLNGDLLVTFLPMWPWNTELYRLHDEFDSDHFHNTDIVQLMHSHVRADQFVFTVGVDLHMGTWVAVCAGEFWQRQQHMWDGEMAFIVDGLSLPFQLGELSEGAFELVPPHGAPISGETAIRLMAGAGFAIDNSFISFMNAGLEQE